MSLINETALKKRARQLLVAMTERQRYIYALPPQTASKPTMEVVIGHMEALGIPRVRDDAKGNVVQFGADDEARFIVFAHEELAVVFIEASGPGVVEPMRQLLETTGFVPQSQLLSTALDVANPDAASALQVLAHMTVSWDEDWTDLFVLHLASPDPLVRRQALSSLTLGSMVAQVFEPAKQLLQEAARRETMPRLAEAIADAQRVVAAGAGEPVDMSQWG